MSYKYSQSFPGLLEQLRTTLLISTYQAGKLAIIGEQNGKLEFSFHNFDRPMGLAIARDQIAVGSRTQIWFLQSAPQIVRQLPASSQADACFLTRKAHVTGEIQCHEMAFACGKLWVVNTLFSCLCTLHSDYSFVPQWQPPFISALAAEDRCHLNGLAIVEGQPKYVTALAETDTAHGWRASKGQSGCLMDMSSGHTIARGFAMPHSPRFYDGKLWLADSGRGQLVSVDPIQGGIEVVARVPGYARGLAILNGVAFVGLSKIRETSTFGGLPIAERAEPLLCGVGAIELASGRTLATLEFDGGVDEIFDVALLGGIRWPVCRGPFASEDGGSTIWVVPEPGRGPKMA